MLFYCCLAITCAPLLFYVTNTSATFVGTVVNVSCENGISTETEQLYTVTVCGPTGRWNPNVPECRGRFVLVASHEEHNYFFV